MGETGIRQGRKILFLIFFATFAMIVMLMICTRPEKEQTEVFRFYPGSSQTQEDGSVMQTVPLDEKQQGEMDTIAFFTIHQKVYVYADGREIYRLDQDGGAWGHTTGNVWNFCQIPVDTDTLTIHTVPCYPNVQGATEVYLMGAGYEIYNELLLNSLGEFLVGLIIIIIGIYMLVYWTVVHRTTDVNPALFNLGLFSVVLGLWATNETDVMALLFENRIASAFMAFSYLMLMGIPFAMFVREFLEIGDKKIWKRLCQISVTEMILCYILHFTGIRELRQTLIFTHLILVLAILYLIGGMIYKIVRRQVDQRLKICMVGLVFVIVATLYDITRYHTGARDSDLFALLAFLVFILILGVESARQTFDMIAKGRRAKELEQFALYDEMTGLYNRNAYDHFVKNEKQLADCMIVTFDLNNLKQCNDGHGHAVGDRYIKMAAQLIEEVFGKYGKCYRIGGDEFCAIVNEAGKCPIRRLIQKLRQGLVRLNSLKELPVYMDIACGYAVYDPQDSGMEDVRSRADAMMYRDKENLKQRV